MSERKLRIAMLVDTYGGTFIGGGQIHVKHLKTYLENNHGCEVIIFSQKSENILNRLLWSIVVLPLVIIAHIKKPFSCIHSQTQSLGPAAKILSEILRIPCIQSIHGAHLMDQNDTTLKGKLEQFFLTKIVYDGEITDSQSFLQYPNVNKHVFYIPNGASIIKKSKEKINKIKRKHAILRLLFIGRLEKIKGLDVLIKALAQIKNKSWVLDVIGDGSLKSELIQLHKELGLAKNILFHGSKKHEELADYYYNADIFILPSLAEGQPVSLLEAWSYALPIIVSRVGNNPYMVTEKKDGLLIDPGDVKDLLKTIEWCFSNLQWLKILGQKGLDNIRTKYTWDLAAKKTYRAYQSIMHQS
jgi:glycosyltransferase involved in cell wall biosynthesis